MKRYHKWLSLALAVFVLIQLTLFVFPAYAAGSQSVTIHLTEEIDGKQAPVSGVRLYYWKVSDETTESKESAESFLKRLTTIHGEDYKDHSALNRKFGKGGVSVPSDSDGRVYLNLPYGKYYIISDAYPNGKYYLSPLVVISKSTSETNIEGKPMDITIPHKPNNPSRIVGDHNFIKVGDSRGKNPLAGAKFRVTKKEKDKYVTVQRDGKDYVVESGEDGRFKVTDLPYGTYYLWETVAPQNYRTLRDRVAFEVDKNSKTSEVTRIVNKPDTGNKVSIPKTGDFMLTLLCVVGAMFFFLGSRLVKEK